MTFALAGEEFKAAGTVDAYISQSEYLIQIGEYNHALVSLTQICPCLFFHGKGLRCVTTGVDIEYDTGGAE